MSAQVFPVFPSDSSQAQGDWRKSFFEKLESILDEMEKGASMNNLLDITRTVFDRKSSILGEIPSGIIEARFSSFLNQEHFDCPLCAGKLKSRGKHKRKLETMAGEFTLERPYFYCANCKKGFYPLDEILELSSSSKQYDVQDVEAWLSSELPFETAAETYRRCTGGKIGAGHMHDRTRRIAEDLDILDVCPTREEIERKIEETRGGAFRRPVMVLAVDGAHAPVRPEPSPRKGKRGKGRWKESKGFRLYLIDGDGIVHLASWHRIATDRELLEDLETIEKAGLVCEGKARLSLLGDGAGWIWNRIGELFPSARRVLDYYHCSEHLHGVARAQYGAGSEEAGYWVEATLVRLFHDKAGYVIGGLKRMIPASPEAAEEIRKLVNYLTVHKDKINYGKLRRGGYHIGSGAIESANKFIGHVRLKRSGAWWYPSRANEILKLRCAKYNGVYDRVIELYKEKDQERLRQKKFLKPGKDESPK